MGRELIGSQAVNVRIFNRDNLTAQTAPLLFRLASTNLIIDYTCDADFTEVDRLGRETKIKFWGDL